MLGRAPLRTSSPSHPRLDSGKGEWHANIHCINMIRSTNKKERNHDLS